MRERLIYAGLVLVGLLGIGVAQSPALDIFIAYPPKNYEVEFDHVLFEGSVQPGSSLSIDGRTVDTGTDGLFIEWLPLKAGANTLSLESKRGDVIVKQGFTVTSVIGEPLPASPARILSDSVQPAAPILEYSAIGSQVTVAFSGSPSGTASYTIGSSIGQRMPEVSRGSYRATYTLLPAETLEATSVRVTLTAPDGSSVNALSPATVTVQGARAPRVGIFTGEYSPVVQPGINVARNQPGREYILFPRAGAKFIVMGEVGSSYRARISADQHVFIRKDKMQLLPEGTPLPQNIVDPIYSKRTANATEVYLAGTELVPYSFEQSEDSLTVRLYTTESDVGSMVFAQPDPTLKNLRWFQERDGVMKAVMTFKNRQQWGYTAEYVGTTLKIRLRDQPKNINALRPLEGRSVTIDAGHGGEDTGGAGPLRVPEKNLMLQISLKLAALLREQGARVVMTRTTDSEVDLFERSLIADREQTEVFLSIHANAIPDGANPADFRGAGAYYFHPQARSLAEYALSGIVRAVPEMGNDGVHYQNLAVTRTQAQPQVLLELGFLTDKANLRLMTSSAGQQRIIAGIATGLAQFYREQTRR